MIWVLSLLYRNKAVVLFLKIVDAPAHWFFLFLIVLVVLLLFKADNFYNYFLQQVLLFFVYIG